VFVAVLGASSYIPAYAGTTWWTQTLPDWCASHVRALRFCGEAMPVTPSARDDFRSVYVQNPVASLEEAHHYMTVARAPRGIGGRDDDNDEPRGRTTHRDRTTDRGDRRTRSQARCLYTAQGTEGGRRRREAPEDEIFDKIFHPW